MTVTPDERELFSELAALERRSRGARRRRLPPRPTLRSALCGCAVLVISAAFVVTYSYLAPDATVAAISTAARGPVPQPVVPARSRPVTAPRDRPLPAFVWVASRGATSYEFRLLRGNELVFSARTAQPRLELPRTWTVGRQTRRLVAGAYRWDVRPLFGKRRGAVTVRARLTVAA